MGRPTEQEFLAVDLASPAHVLLFSQGKQLSLKNQMLVPFGMDFSADGIREFAKAIAANLAQIQSECTDVVLTCSSLPSTALGKSKVTPAELKTAAKSIAVKNKSSETLEDLRSYKGKNPMILSLTVQKDVLQAIHDGFSDAGFEVRGVWEFQSCLATALQVLLPKQVGLAAVVLDMSVTVYASALGVPRGRKVMNGEFPGIAQGLCQQIGLNYEQFAYLMQVVGVVNDASLYPTLQQFGVDPSVWYGSIIPGYFGYIDAVGEALAAKMTKDAQTRFVLTGTLTSFRGTVERLQEKLPGDQIFVPIYEGGITGGLEVTNNSGSVVMPEMFLALCAAFGCGPDVFDLEQLRALSNGEKFVAFQPTKGAKVSKGSAGKASKPAKGAGAEKSDKGQKPAKKSGGFFSKKPKEDPADPDSSGVSSDGSDGSEGSNSTPTKQKSKGGFLAKKPKDTGDGSKASGANGRRKRGQPANPNAAMDGEQPSSGDVAGTAVGAAMVAEAGAVLAGAAGVGAGAEIAAQPGMPNVSGTPGAPAVDDVSAVDSVPRGKRQPKPKKEKPQKQPKNSRANGKSSKPEKGSKTKPAKGSKKGSGELDIQQELAKLPSVQSQLINAPPEVVQKVLTNQLDVRDNSAVIRLVMQSAVERMETNVEIFFNLVLLCGFVLLCTGAMIFGSATLTKLRTGDPMKEIKSLTEQRASLVQQVEAKENYFRTKNEAFEKYMPYMEYLYNNTSESIVIDDFNLIGDTSLLINARCKSSEDFNKLFTDFQNLESGMRILESKGNEDPVTGWIPCQFDISIGGDTSNG